MDGKASELQQTQLPSLSIVGLRQSLMFASELGGYVSVDLGGVYGKESP